ATWQHAAHTMSMGFSFYREQDHYWNPPAGFPNYGLGLATGDPAIQAFSPSSLPNADATAIAQAGQIYAILTGRVHDVGDNMHTTRRRVPIPRVLAPTTSMNY